MDQLISPRRNKHRLDRSDWFSEVCHQ